MNATVHVKVEFYGIDSYLTRTGAQIQEMREEHEKAGWKVYELTDERWELFHPEHKDDVMIWTFS